MRVVPPDATDAGRKVYREGLSSSDKSASVALSTSLSTTWRPRRTIRVAIISFPRRYDYLDAFAF
jgi:hypothetical protein